MEPSFTCVDFIVLDAFVESKQVGVGSIVSDEPNPVSSVGSVDGTSWK
jgi:hypothetical protein